MDGLVMLFTVFVLAIFVGFEIITKVPPTLHTPLMSGSNAISGITIIGALVLAGNVEGGSLAQILAFVAVIFATINVVGGFLVTDRMLKMFKSKGKAMPSISYFKFRNGFSTANFPRKNRRDVLMYKRIILKIEIQFI